MKKFTDLKPIKKVNEDSKYFKPKTSEYKPILEAEKPKTGPVAFFSKIFESKELAHVYHLQVKGDMGSDAKHQALQDYYEGILEPLDDLIELYQGQFGKILQGYDIIDTTKNAKTDTIEYFTDLADFIKKERYKCFDRDDTHYFNIIDDILVMIYKLLYKLKFTK
jgi:hypothetical protein